MSGGRGPLDREVIEDELALFWVALASGNVEEMALRLAHADRQLSLAGLDVDLLRAEWWLARSDLAARDGSDPAVHRDALTRARDLYRRIAPTDSGHVATLSNLGLLALQDSRPEQALQDFDEALRLHPLTPQRVAPDLARLQARRAQALADLGRATEANAALAESERIFDRSVGLDSPLAGEFKTVAERLRSRAAE